MQCYLDDPIMIVAGTPEQRRKIIAFILLTLRMLGVEVAWHKASRGMSCTWIGVLFTLCLQKVHLVVTWPEKTLEGLRSEASAI